MISYDEVKRNMWKKMSVWGKIRWFYFGAEIFLGDLLHKHFGIGEHQTVGRVGAKKAFCMVCNTVVDNEDYKEERRAMRKLKTA